MVYYHVIYENSSERRVTDSMKTIEECNDRIKHISEVDKKYNTWHVFKIVQTLENA